ncbi:type VI secretion system protein [Sphingomonas sp. DG1-23]|uniref:type VI secretion system protein n=1 Tax=Sphingomonas sp. DG1-23 TaxID=3068316 RepID=UPI00273F7670|nr:type VI secretion system protein [Sphingomonas sp. DG1-23]MDP5280601.1 type VI secretion system protein [Sphingomonas sp. DG1-23]
MNGTLLAGIIGGLTLLLFVGLFIAVKWGGLVKIEAPAAPAADAPALRPSELAPPAKLRTTIRIALRELRVLVAGGRGPTEVPWTLVVGVGHADYEALLPAPLQFQHEMSWLDDQRLAKVGTVSFRDGGVVIGFEDGAVEPPQAERRLIDLLREVEVVRPHRPIDSLIVVIPCPFLMDAATAPDLAATRGRQLYDIILTVQQRTGWRVPVYLVLSDADRIQGFAPIAQAVLAHSANPMIGWPAPKALDSLFEPSWIDEAFEAMRSTLSTEQIHLLMSLDGDRIAEDVLLFPDRLARIKPALAVLLGQMLETSAYHEGFMLRGIFLTGETSERPQLLDLGPPDAMAEEEAPAVEPEIAEIAPAVDPQPLADTLFRRKIFPEAGLAQPAYGEMTRRHRMVRRAKIALAASVLLSLAGFAAVQHQTSRHLPPVKALLDDILRIGIATDRNEAATRVRGSGKCMERVGVTVATPEARARFRARRDLSISLLESMSRLDVNRVETLFAPTSFLSHTNAEIQAAIESSFHDVVFDAISESMATPAGIDALVTQNASQPDAAISWKAVTDNVVLYDRNYRIARSMETMTAEDAAAVKSFSDLVSYALFEQLPPRFTRNYELYSAGITDHPVPCLSSEMVRQTLQDVLARRYRLATELMYLRNPLMITTNSIAARFTAIDGIDSSDESLMALVKELDAISAELAAAGKYSWVYAASVEEMPVLPIDRLYGLQVVDRAFARRLPEENRQIAFDAAVRLRSAQLFDAALLSPDLASSAPAAPGTPGAPGAPAVPVAAVAAIETPALSKAAVDSREFLRKLFAQPYMDAGPPTAATATATGSRVSWDLARLQVAQKAVESYAEFVASGSGDAPIELRNIALASAEQHFAGHLEQLVNQAAQPGTAAAGNETANFVQALPVLIKIRDALRGAGAEQSAAGLDTRVADQAGRLLADADRALTADGGPYAIDPAGLAAWDGTGSLAAALFGVETVDDLKATLPQRRARVADIARSRAAPLIGYLREPGTAAGAATLARANRWQAILLTLDAYDGNSPSNSLARLEQYITVDIDKLQRRDCARARSFSTRSTDYFAAQQAAISARVIGHCRLAAAGSTEAQFDQLREAFNASLAGRFPFASDVEAPAADPGDVQAFFGQFGAVLQPLKDDIDITPGFGGSGRMASATLAQLVRVQSALAPMLDAAGPAPLTYRVGVNFFSDPDLARGQEQVIEGSLGTPVSRALTRGAAREFVWNNGQPVLARFRWAINAPSIPRTGGKCVPQPDGSVASFRVDGDWALFRLLRRHAPGDGIRASVTQGAPVAFDVDLCANQERASGGDLVEDARILARLSLWATVRGGDKPDRQVPVLLPDFPYTIDPLVRVGARR